MGEAKRRKLAGLTPRSLVTLPEDLKRDIAPLLSPPSWFYPPFYPPLKRGSGCLPVDVARRIMPYNP